MKFNTRTLSPACLAAFAFFFALSTPAQKFQVPVHAPSSAAGDDASARGQSQEKSKSNAASPDATQACTYTFTSGTGTTYLQFCVTVNGNIVEFQSPSGIEQIDQGGQPQEGYGICDTSSDTAYYDYAYADSANWNAPTTVTHTATMVKIERTTGDGAWTLTQTITSSAGTNPYAKIVMALKNNSALTKSAYLFRYANANPITGYPYEEDYDGDNDSAWGYTGYLSDSPYGLMIENVGNPTPATALVDREGFAIDTVGGPSACGVTSSTTIYGAVGSIVYFYDLKLTKEQTGTVTDRYISF